MSIGEVLSDARCRSGLSIGEVTRQTRIREEIVWAIELDDFSKCGGDFYARGHIRAIAAVVRVDPAPLIAQYDAEYSARDEPDAYDGPGLLAPPPRDLPSRPERPTGSSRSQRYRRRHRRRVILSTAMCLVVLVIFGGEAYHFARDANPSTKSAAQAAFNRATPRHQAPKAKPAGSHSSAKASSSPSPQNLKPSSSPSPQNLQPVNASAYGPWGVTGDNPQAAGMAIDASSSTAWQTNPYSSADFGGQQTGTGLLIDLGQPEIIVSAELNIGSPGAYVEIRGGPSDSPTALKTIGSTRNAGSTTTIRPQEKLVRYLLIWFTALPRTTTGAYQASIYNITLQGHP
ncbi:MAG TPA: helix-turn-helix domain-containing protein [Streptosporangiaceae bacterium]|nr:helix-turn-helix domain-containing protein [Streptosporangiaceae bacterium]